VVCRYHLVGSTLQVCDPVERSRNCEKVLSRRCNLVYRGISVVPCETFLMDSVFPSLRFDAKSKDDFSEFRKHVPRSCKIRENKGKLRKDDQRSSFK